MNMDNMAVKKGFLCLTMVIYTNAVLGQLINSAEYNNEELYNMIKQMNKSIASLKTENAQLKQQMTTVHVQPLAFYATLTPEIRTIGDNQAIEYDHVITNVGNAYDSRHGHFIAPINGVYFFSVTAMGEANEFLHLSIVKNGAVVGYARSAMSNELETGTAAITLSLARGDMVWVRYRNSYGSVSRRVKGNGYNTFSGALIAAL